MSGVRGLLIHRTLVALEDAAVESVTWLFALVLQESAVCT